jgi:hypothetical protein
LKSIPNQREPALRLVNSLRPFLEFQSTKEILRDPPQGYLFPAIDLDDGLDTIKKKVEACKYESEYDMQIDIHTLLVSAHDGHLNWNGELTQAFTFARTVGLVAVSSDGLELPKIFVAGKQCPHVDLEDSGP